MIWEKYYAYPFWGLFKGYKYNRDCYVGPFYRIKDFVFENDYKENSWIFNTGMDELLRFVEPSTRELHKKLEKEILGGDDIQGYFDIGSDQPAYTKLYILLLVITLLSVFAFFKGYRSLFGEKSFNKVVKPFNRAKTIRFSIFYIVIGSIVGILAVLMSLNLWAANVDYDKHLIDYGIDIIKYRKLELERSHYCRYEVSIKGTADFVEKQISDFSASFSTNLSIQGIIDNQLGLIKKDKVAIGELQQNVSALIDDFESLGDSSIDVVIYLKTVQKELGTLWASFGDRVTTIQRIQEEIASSGITLQKSVLAASQPFFHQLDEVKKRVKVVLDSFFTGYTETADWIKIVGRRNLKAIKSIQQKGDLFNYFLFVQLAVAILSLMALIAILVEFIALVMKIRNPEDCGSNVLCQIRRFMIFSFFVQCFFVGVVALCAGIGLYFSSRLNAFCIPMYSGRIRREPVGQFYQDIGVGTKFIDYNGTIHNALFFEVVFSSNLFDKYELIPFHIEREFDTEAWWKEVTAAIKGNGTGEIRFFDEQQIAKKVNQLSSDFGKIQENLFFKQKNMPNNFKKELDDFQRSLQNLSLPSLEERTYSMLRSDYSHTRRIVNLSISNEFGFYGADVNNDYQDSLRAAYANTGETLCVNLRIPAAGVWYFGTLLSIALLLSAVLTLKTAINLKDDYGRENRSNRKGAPVNKTTIYSPLSK